MGLSKPFSRPLFVIGGAVKTTGGSLQLAKGQLAAVNTRETTADGLKVVSTFAGVPRDEKIFELRLGVSVDRQVSRSRSNKSKQTMPFSLNEVRTLRVAAPQTAEQKVDEVVLGWDGITAGSEFKFVKGDGYFSLAVEVSGGGVPYLGGNAECEVVVLRMEVPECDPFNTCESCTGCEDVDCKTIINDAVAQLRRKQLAGGGTLEDVLEITAITDCDTDVTATLIPYNYYTLSICDTGNDTALALVSAQYNAPVKRLSRKGSTTTYQVLLANSAGAPTAYSQSLASVIKGCAACPAGYTATPEGFLYAFTIEDDGVNLGATFTALTGYVATTITKSGNDNGVGFYTAIYTAAIPAGDIATVLATAGPGKTATFKNLGVVKAICENGTVTNTSWVLGDTCNAIVKNYELILPDTECGAVRTIELQGAYANATVSVANTLNGTRKVTLTGTSGTANVVIGGVNYLATFATSLSVTATNFVTTHATALAALGVVVTAGGADLNFSGLYTTLNAITVVNVTTNLAATLAVTARVVFRFACSTKYNIEIVSNLVCDACDPIFKDFYETVTPAPYDNQSWVLVPSATYDPAGNCKCGILLKGKTFTLSAEESLRNNINFVETSTRVRATAMYAEEIREGIGRLPEGLANTGRYLSTQVDRTYLGGQLRQIEAEGEAYFLGERTHGEYLTKLLRGTTSSIADDYAQYVQYTLGVEHKHFASGFAHEAVDNINYIIFVEVGRHQAVEDLLNNIAVNAGISPVSAFGA